MATVFEGVVVNSVDEDGRFTRVCSNPVKVEVTSTASETSLKLFDGEKWSTEIKWRHWKILQSFLKGCVYSTGSPYLFIFRCCTSIPTLTILDTSVIPLRALVKTVLFNSSPFFLPFSFRIKSRVSMVMLLVLHLLVVTGFYSSVFW